MVPSVSPELRAPVVVTPRPVEVLGDVGLILADHVEALDRANGQIAAIDKILTSAEAKQGVQ